MARGRQPSGVVRDMPPCYGCTERFEACWGKCPKDARGERGYEAWSAAIRQTKAARKQYIERKAGKKHDIC